MESDMRKNPLFGHGLDHGNWMLSKGLATYNDAVEVVEWLNTA